MSNPTPPTPAEDDDLLLDGWGNPVSPWQSDPHLPSTFRAALRATGGPSAAQGKR